MTRRPESAPELTLTRLRAATLIAVATVLILAQIQSEAAKPAPPPPPVSLPYANSFLVTGNYVTGSVDLPGTGVVGGAATGTIHMNGVPTNSDGSPADILGAWLYWETIATDPSQVTGVKFRGLDVKVTTTASLPLAG